MAQLVQGSQCEKPRPSTCQVKVSIQPGPWQAAGPHNSYLSRLNALYSGNSDQTAQPCTLVYETLPPEPHALCPTRPCEPQLRQGSSGQALQREEGQGHGLGPLTHNLILFQIDVLQCRQGGELLREVAELVPGQINGLEVLQGADLIGKAVQEVPFQVKFCQVGRKSKEGGSRNNPEPTVTAGCLGQEGCEETQMQRKSFQRAQSIFMHKEG